MTQKYDQTFDMYTTNWGTTGQKLNDFFETIFTLNAGDTAPINPRDGEPWLDTSNGFTDAVLKIYNGTEWVLANEYNPYIKELKLARGSKESIWERLEVALNEDGTLKSNLEENMTEWIDSSSSPSYVSDSEFSIPGDNTDIYNKNRRIKATLDASIVYSSIESSTYDSVNDKTVVSLYDAVIDSSLQKIEHGLIKSGIEGSQPRPIYKDDNDGSLYSLKIIDGSLAMEVR